MAEDANFESSLADLDVSKETTKNDEVGEETNIVKEKKMRKGFEDTNEATEVMLKGAMKEAEENYDNTAKEEQPDDDEMNFSLPMQKKKEAMKEALENDDNSAKEEQEEPDEMNFSLPMKKKKKKKKQPEKTEMEKDEEEREYTYDELLTRTFEKRIRIITPHVFKLGTKKTCFRNFGDFCESLRRERKHLLAFLLAELGTSGSIDSDNQLIIKGRFQQKQIESALSRYIKEYVTCHTCGSLQTILQQEMRLYFLRCEACRTFAEVGEKMNKENQVVQEKDIVKEKKMRKGFEDTNEATEVMLKGAMKEAEENDDNTSAKEEQPDDDEMNFSLPMQKKKEAMKEALENDDNSAKEEQEEPDEMNFSLPMKKKKKKKKQPEKTEMEKDEEEREYTYDELLTRAFEKRIRIITPHVFKLGTKKTCFRNFGKCCESLRREQKHLLAFLLAELGTSGSIDSANQLIIKGRFQQKQIESVLSRYIKEYVTCHTCGSLQTILEKETRWYFLRCETCRTLHSLKLGKK